MLVEPAVVSAGTLDGSSAPGWRGPMADPRPERYRASKETQRLQELPPYWRDPSSLRHVGKVQAHGILIALRLDDGAVPLVRRVSANLGELIGVPAESALGGPLSSVLAPDSLLAVVGALSSLRSRPAASPPASVAVPVELRLSTVNGVEWSGLLHATEPSPDGSPAECIVELEPLASPIPGAPPLSPNFNEDMACLSARSMQMAEESTSVEDLVQGLIPLFADIVRFDRCMIYRFDSQKDGQVIAECLRDDTRAPLLGMSFPGMDIPPAARGFFMLNRFRAIPDVCTPPVAILSHPEQPPLDLARSTLRSVSPCHLQYLKNMGVQATIVNSIVISGSLWGLFVCHNHTPKYCDRRTRLACNNFVMVLASQIAWVQERQYRRADTKARELHAALLESAQKSGRHQTFLKALFSSDPSVKDLITCCGVALASAGGTRQLQEAADGEEVCEYEATGNCPRRESMAPPAHRGTDLLASLPRGHHPLASRNCPRREAVLHLAAFVERECVKRASAGQDEVFASDFWTRDIPSSIPPPKGICGVLATRLSSGSIVMYFREELSTTRKWAGREADLKSPGRHLNPRDSFELWVEYTKGQSEYFGPGDFAALSVLRSVWGLNEKLGVSRQLKLVSQGTNLKQLMEAVTVPVITLCRDGLIADWNPKAEELFGLTRAAMLGKCFVDSVVDPQHAAETREAIRAASLGRAVGSKGREVEFATRSKDDSRPSLDILMRVVTRQDAQSGVLGVCCICGGEAKELKELEPCSKAAPSSPPFVGGTLTDLTERKSKMKAEIRAEETRKFLATMSHEMRTPLNGVLGMLQLAKDYPLHPAAAEYIDGAVRSGEHLLNLINALHHASTSPFLTPQRLNHHALHQRPPPRPNIIVAAPPNHRPS
eukprot:tig00020563_g11225.t1